MIYVCNILNHIACGALNGSIPLLLLDVITPDISIMLRYTFYQPVFWISISHQRVKSKLHIGYDLVNIVEINDS